MLPKFGEFAAEENYYKLIEDFDCYDTITGEHSSQEAVDFFHDGLPADYKNVLVKALKAEQKVSDDFRDHLDNHELSIDDIITISRKMGDPSYIVLQENGRYAEVVSFYNKRNKQVIVAIDMANSQVIPQKNYKHTPHMNGYDQGCYNIIVTQYEPDVERKGEPFDYIEYLLLRGDNQELDIIKENPESEAAYRQTEAAAPNKEFSNDIVPQKGKTVKKQLKTPTNRSILANALEGAAQNDIERKKLEQYKEKISLIEAEEQRLAEIQKQLFTKGAVEPKQRKDLQFEAKQISNRINIYDRQLLNLESTTALKNVLNREKTLAMKRQKQKDAEALNKYKEKVAKTQRELITRYQESRKKAVEGREMTAMRHKIKKVVGDLNNLLLKPSKERHVPEEMRVAVAEALNVVNMDTVDAETRAANCNDLQNSINYR